MDNTILDSLKILHKAGMKFEVVQTTIQTNTDIDTRNRVFRIAPDSRRYHIPSIEHLESVVVEAFLKVEMRLEILFWGVWEYASPNRPDIYSRNSDRLTALLGFICEEPILKQIKELYK